MTVGFFSPMPPARTGVADYSAALIAALRRHVTVSLNDPAAAIALYHLGNNQLHREIYARALSQPGVIVIHDAVLHHFMLGSLPEREYLEEFVYNYGDWNLGLAERLWRYRARSGSDPLYFRYPMLKRIVERSRAVIVHNAAAARMVRAHVPGARVFEIPHLFKAVPAPPEYAVTRLRAGLGITPSTFLFGVFGHLRESKRLQTVLRAFRALHDAGERIALLVAGEFASSDLARATESELRGAGIQKVGYTPEITFHLYASAVDACINLRAPTAGETSGIAIRLMGIGKPVLLTAGEEISGFPESARIAIDPGTAELDMLIENMRWLVRFRSDAVEVGIAARRHVLERHEVSKVAALYWQALEESRA